MKINIIGIDIVKNKNLWMSFFLYFFFPKDVYKTTFIREVFIRLKEKDQGFGPSSLQALVIVFFLPTVLIRGFSCAPSSEKYAFYSVLKENQSIRFLDDNKMKELIQII